VVETELLLDQATGRTVARFLLHLFEMLVVMMVGMCALGGAARALYVLIAGHSFVLEQHVLLAAFVMAVTMTLPMVLWMRHRGHTWERGGEMSLAMLVPTLVALVVFWAGAIAADTVLGLTMILMLPAMIGAMLYRKEEYSAPYVAHRQRGRWFAQTH
jgi:flagellar biosynthetic protein FliP